MVKLYVPHLGILPSKSGLKFEQIKRKKQATFVLTYLLNLHTQKTLPHVLFMVLVPDIVFNFLLILFVLDSFLIYNVSVYRMFFVCLFCFVCNTEQLE